MSETPELEYITPLDVNAEPTDSDYEGELQYFDAEDFPSVTEVDGSDCE